MLALMPCQRLENALIDWEDGQPRSRLFSDIYFSGEDALAETGHVFLQGNELARRFSQCRHDTFCIGELGFGSGLNFLLSWQLWEQTAPSGKLLHFISCEQFPLKQEDFRRFQTLWPGLSEYSQALQAVYQDHSPGLHRLFLGSAEHPVILDLLYGDATHSLSSLLDPEHNRVDTWFLDGFAPRSNPDMWSNDLCQQLARYSHAGTTLATYSVAASVRTALSEAGFSLSKAEGFGSKRHMLTGQYQTDTPSLSAATTQEPEITIIGAGLAGSACAYALARRGYRVNVLEATSPGSGASGNPQGALFLPLHRDVNLRAEFLRQAALFAARYYQQLDHNGLEFDWHACGALQLNEKNGPGFFDRVSGNDLYCEQLVRHESKENASRIAGVDIPQSALHLPLAGWLNPGKLCGQYLRHPDIQLRCGQAVASLQRGHSRWQLLDKRGNTLTEATHVIVASSVDAPRLLAKHHYPLFPNRGQLSLVRASSLSEKLSTVLCGKGYLLPSVDGLHCLGSSFHPRCEDTTITEEDHQHNLALLSELSPALASSFSESAIAGGRASLRCTTRDYLPLAGPVEDYLKSQNTLAGNAGRVSLQPGMLTYEPGLYLCSGLGSHGITTSPLLAEHLASLISGNGLPLSPELRDLVLPGRFLLREMQRG